jgi:nucleoid DNA-binding protein
MRPFFVLTVLFTAGVAVMVNGPASAMNKAELIDVIASESKLSKADAKRALEGFIDATTKALKKGDRISLVGFGSFSVSKRVASPNGCASGIEVDFSPASTFLATREEGGRHTPFHNKLTHIRPQPDGTTVVLGPNNGAPVARGEDIILRKAPGARGSDDGVVGVVLGVVVASSRGGGESSYEILENGAGKLVAGLHVGGFPPGSLERGDSLETLPPSVEDDPIGACPEGGYGGIIVSDAELLKEMTSETRLPAEQLTAAYNALLDTIIEVVNAGDVIDLGESFGGFVEETLLSVSVSDDPCAGVPENCPPTGTADTVYPFIDFDVSVQSGLVDDKELRQLEAAVDRLAQRAASKKGYDYYQAKSSTKKVVRFKAGAELSKKVN